MKLYEMQHPFKFPLDIRDWVESLARLMEYANSRDDNSMVWGNGVYNAAEKTLVAIVRAQFGEEAARLFDECLEFGGSGNWHSDVLVSLRKAWKAMAEESLRCDLEHGAIDSMHDEELHAQIERVACV